MLYTSTLLSVIVQAFLSSVFSILTVFCFLSNERKREINRAIWLFFVKIWQLYADFSLPQRKWFTKGRGCSIERIRASCYICQVRTSCHMQIRKPCSLRFRHDRKGRGFCIIKFWSGAEDLQFQKGGLLLWMKMKRNLFLALKTWNGFCSAFFQVP